MNELCYFYEKSKKDLLNKYNLTKDDLIINYNNRQVVINPILLEKQKAWNNLELIKELHIKKLMIYDEIEKEYDINKLPKYATKITKIEFNLQEAWNFSKDVGFHRFWLTPRCECPKLDNEDSWGTKYCIINENCPLHGLTNKK